MNDGKFKTVAKGLIKLIPYVENVIPSKRVTGGTDESRYCYSVWLRHLHFWNNHREGVPSSIAELGPGDSLGTGLAALLSGSNYVFALDVIKFWDSERNLKIFNELVELFKKREDIPDQVEFSKVVPTLKNWKFPAHVLTDSLLKESLAEDRLNAIRKELKDIDNPDNKFIKYKIPWNHKDVIAHNELDFVFGQGTLQHIDDLDNCFHTMNLWMKPNGLMAHTVELKSLGLTNSWNGHWTYPDWQWKIIRGNKPFLINRQPFSTYVKMHDKHGFKLLEEQPIKSENTLTRSQLNSKFKNLSEDDLTTSLAYMIAVKL